MTDLDFKKVYFFPYCNFVNRQRRKLCFITNYRNLGLKMATSPSIQSATYFLFGNRIFEG